MIKTLRNLLKQDKERFVVPRGVQDVIPIKAIYDDGIFQVGRDIHCSKDLMTWRLRTLTLRLSGQKEIIP